MMENFHGAGYPKLVKGFEGGSVSTAERDGNYLVIINQVALLDMLDPEDREGMEGIATHAFASTSERDDYLRMRGWLGGP
ncbi:MAG: hypothetical protein ABIT64_00550 [Lysobacteraceae bacterium]